MEGNLIKTDKGVVIVSNEKINDGDYITYKTLNKGFVISKYDGSLISAGNLNAKKIISTYLSFKLDGINQIELNH